MKLPLVPLDRRRLRFECTQCGACCRKPGLVHLHPDEPARLAAYLGLEVRAFAARYLRRLPGGRMAIVVHEGSAGCPLLAGDRCSVEAVKPGQCRAYPFWPELVGDPAAWRAEKRKCEGLGRGPVWPAAEIRRLLALDPGVDGGNTD
ncbi:YkgJ family cysteine cluster protein [Vulgatibacter sp.]|uniref:YkgJ family cysteine cluster protein n=1 Tax=Vulgatibacter sp. TaxID=1971226 RepID=UPI0035677C1B